MLDAPNITYTDKDNAKSTEKRESQNKNSNYKIIIMPNVV